ncbi:MAG: hypothetical protein FJ137_18315, partial [Deltaproteobacteria bacterium]|nr:hypothetical protein [Deltaproteobacteria bacterium]
MSLKRVLLAGVGALAVSSCATQNQPVGDEGRALKGIAPAGADQVLAIDTDGLTFAATPGADGAFTLAIDSVRPVSLFVIGADVRVLKMAPADGAAQSQTVMPNWTGEVNTAQLSTCD